MDRDGEPRIPEPSEGDHSDPYEDTFPTPTSGSGRPVSNNLKTGGAQGQASSILKVPCKECGFLNDVNAIDHSGGDETGNGGTYVVNTGTATITLASGVSHTENYGTPGIRTGSGCANCGSKNSVKGKVPKRRAGLQDFADDIWK